MAAYAFNMYDKEKEEKKNEAASDLISSAVSRNLGGLNEF